MSEKYILLKKTLSIIYYMGHCEQKGENEVIYIYFHKILEKILDNNGSIGKDNTEKWVNFNENLYGLNIEKLLSEENEDNIIKFMIHFENKIIDYITLYQFTTDVIMGYDDRFNTDHKFYVTDINNNRFTFKLSYMLNCSWLVKENIINNNVVLNDIKVPFSITKSGYEEINYLINNGVFSALCDINTIEDLNTIALLYEHLGINFKK
jgi:hypothetical protein